MWALVAVAETAPLLPRILNEAVGPTPPPIPRTRFARAVAAWTSGKGFPVQGFVTSARVLRDKEKAGHMPAKMVGMYVLCSDNGDPTYTDSHNWTPQLRKYQVEGANTFFLTFIDPSTMQLPSSMKNLAATRGSDAEGSVHPTFTLIASVGGDAYSKVHKQWPFLQTPESARAMAAEVAEWDSKYGIDGIDIDIEWGAGNHQPSVPNLVIFIAELGALNPSFIITQPVYGIPQVPAESSVVNAAWASTSNASISRIGIMVYDGDASLQYVNQYAGGSNPKVPQVHVNVPREAIMVGIGGDATAQTIAKMASAVVSQDLSGMFVWYGSLLDKTTGKTGLQYGKKSDAASWPEADEGRWKSARKNIVHGELSDDWTFAAAPPPPPPLQPGETCFDLPPPADWGCCRGSCVFALHNGVCDESFIKHEYCHKMCGRCK